MYRPGTKTEIIIVTINVKVNSEEDTFVAICCMTTLLGCFSYMVTVKNRFWVMSSQRNRTSFVSFELRVSLIWRVLLVWLWWKYRLGGFQSPWTSHLGLSYRFLVSFVHVVPHRLFKLLPSYFFLRVLPKQNMMSVYFILSLVFVFIIDLTWHHPSLGLRLFLFWWKLNTQKLVKILLVPVCP